MSILNGSISNQPLSGYQYSLVLLSLGKFWFDQFWIVQFSIAHLAFSNFTQSPAPWSATFPVIGQIWPQGVGSGRVEASPLPWGGVLGGWAQIVTCTIQKCQISNEQFTIDQCLIDQWIITTVYAYLSCGITSHTLFHLLYNIIIVIWCNAIYHESILFILVRCVLSISLW